MIRYEQESQSEILRATHILHVRLESVKFGEWIPAFDGLVQTTATAQFQVLRVFKGDIAEGAKGAVGATFEVFEIRGPRYVALPSPWSKVKLEPGNEFIAFAKSKSGAASDALSDPAVFMVQEAGNALVDVEIAFAASSPELSVPVLLAEAGARRGQFGFLLARYVGARMKEVFFQNPGAFHAILKEVEHAETSEIFRSVLIRELYIQLIMYDPAPPAFVLRLLWGSLRLITSGIGEKFKGPVMEVMIPNLLGLEGGLTKKTARELSVAVPSIWQQIREMLEQHTDLPGREPLVAWSRLE